MPKSARGQITIVDLNDGKTVSAYLKPSKATSQIYNTDNKSYTPNWSSSDPMKLYPELYVSGGTSTNQVGTAAVTAISWLINGNAISQTAGASAAFDSDNATGCYLQLAANMTSAQYRIECTITYHDSATGLNTTVKTTLTIQKNDTTGSSIRMLMYTPEGTTFHRDETTGGTSSTQLTIHAELWRGSTRDTTGISYAWYKDGTLITSSNAGKITGYNNTNGVLTVTADDIANVSLFKCVITDTDDSSATHNQTVTDAVSLYDMTDEFEVEIQSTTGDTLTSSATSTTLNAVVKQHGEVIPTTNAIYTNAIFLWKMYNRNGELVKYYNPTTKTWVASKPSDTDLASASAKANKYSGVVVNKSDITYRCTIICEVTGI